MIFFFDRFQGNCQGGRTEQHFSAGERDDLHGPGDPRHPEAEAASVGTGEPGSAGGHCQGCQHGHQRVPASVPESTVELLDEEFPPREESVREDR